MARVVFVCAASSARGQLAEGLARARFGERIPVASAGTEPTGVSPLVVDVLRDRGIEVASDHAQRLDELDPTDVELVVTLSAEEVCPDALGRARRLHWPIADPAVARPDPPVPPAFEARRDDFLHAFRRAPFRAARDHIEARLAGIEPMLATPPGTTISPARAEDRGELEALLRACELPLDGLDDCFPDGTALARIGGALVGAAAIERWEAHALLRSVAVAPSHRKQHVADALVADRTGWARSAGAQTLVLLTLSARDYFARLGFTAIPRPELPAAVTRSTQLAIPACSTAVAMTKRLVERTTDDLLDEHIARELAEHGTLVPPWHKYPEIPRRSIGWRMGSGEWYLWMWQRWWQSLDAAARAAYVARFWPSRPDAWRDWSVTGADR